jgi:hypothetical protein
VCGRTARSGDPSLHASGGVSSRRRRPAEAWWRRRTRDDNLRRGEAARWRRSGF